MRGVADYATCPICQKTGFVRVETVIVGDTSDREGHCGACDNSWPVAAAGRLKQSVWRRSKPPGRAPTR